MNELSRRDVLKSGMASGVGVSASASVAQAQPPVGRVEAVTGRERQLLDFGWRFHFGNANDAARDFDFGAGRSGGFQKTGDFLSPSSLAFDDSEWKPVDLPHDWAIGLPFQNDPALTSNESTWPW